MTRVSVSEIIKHSSPDDLWIVVNGKVYDLTNFAPNHPGGADVLYAFAGRDGSKTYNEFHSATLIERELSDSEKKGELDEGTLTEEWLEAQKTELEKAATGDDDAKPALSSIISLHDFETFFEKSSNQKGFAYISSGANDNLTREANLTSWSQIRFRPQILNDVSAVDMRSSMLGVPVSMPVMISPMGMGKTGGPQGEKALGHCAAASGIVHCVSTVASYDITEVVAAAPQANYFFQLYVDKNRAKSEALLRQVEALPQVKGVFVTVDLPVVSKREADERISSAPQNLVRPGHQGPKIDEKGAGVARTTGGFIDSTFSWKDLVWLKKATKLPIVIKGIQSPLDAVKALEAGCQGIVISNHGGRALDTAPSTLEVLLEVRRDAPHIFDKIEVFVDGGVRRGSDILKAVILGARGVGIGRPFQYSLAWDDKGPLACAEILQDELGTAMKLCGITNLDGVRGRTEWLNTVELEAKLPPPLPMLVKARL
ncbi:hypothetical protein K470DRAFT_256878 [Piedraia hortae CBS 480.64]|uniref:Uncharacterized protein n=1 Tax=Piedraia hortae CBS 480.64 TaxID=1314780 RepID=A0A6A7C1W9_9PEZI|nr:hypothetical protein K470DRAFT_256878 [Piedraia hortae CBS 480.64]